MSRINKDGVLDTQKIELVMDRCKYVFDVTRVCSVQISAGRCGNKLVSVDMECSGIDSQPCDSGFMEDVRALAKQYGLKIESIEVSRNNN